MRFKADEIASVIQQEVEQFESRIDVREVGRVIEVGDGIARVYGLSNVMAGEMVQFPGEVYGLAFNLEENSVGVIILGDYLKIEEGDEVCSTGRLLSVPVGDAVLGRVLDPLGNPLDGGPPVVTSERRPVEIYGPRRGRAAAGEAAAANRHQGHRRHDAHRPRPAGIDHRRPPHRQDGHLHRHDHQSEDLRGEVLLRGHRPEGIEHRRAGRDAPPPRRDGLHDGDRGRGQRSGPAAIRGPLRRLRDGRVLHVQGPGRLDRLRRPLEAGPGLPAAFALDAASAGTRGLPGRHFLRPQPPPGAGRQAQQASTAADR